MPVAGGLNGVTDLSLDSISAYDENGVNITADVNAYVSFKQGAAGMPGLR